MNEIARGFHDGCWMLAGAALATERFGMAAVMVIGAFAIKLIGGRL